jgi:hypothetical protein
MLTRLFVQIQLVFLSHLTEVYPADSSDGACVVFVSDEFTLFTDGLGVVDASGADVAGCEFIAPEPSLIVVESTADVVLVGTRWFAELGPTQSVPIPNHGEYEFGVPPVEGSSTQMCCMTICVPFLGCTTVCQPCNVRKVWIKTSACYPGPGAC